MIARGIDPGAEYAPMTTAKAMLRLNFVDLIAFYRTINFYSTDESNAILISTEKASVALEYTNLVKKKK